MIWQKMSLALALSALLATSLPADETKTGWQTDYAAAWNLAKEQRKMMLIWFHSTTAPGNDYFAANVLAGESVASRLPRFILAKLPLDAAVVSGGQSTPLLSHSSFQHMCRCPGLAIIDLTNPQSQHYGNVVSVLPFSGRYASAREVAALLDLPAGSLTQRTLIYAVRTHPESPASTQGTCLPLLAREAESHAQHQASINVQGHHNWNTRFQRISAQLPGGLAAQEVCAESWPGQGLMEAAKECVHSWRQSPGHWSAVRAGHPYYGYDMKLGSNGVWYGTGIFGQR